MDFLCSTADFCNHFEYTYSTLLSYIFVLAVWVELNKNKHLDLKYAIKTDSG